MQQLQPIPHTTALSLSATDRTALIAAAEAYVKQEMSTNDGVRFVLRQRLHSLYLHFEWLMSCAAM